MRRWAAIPILCYFLFAGLYGLDQLGLYHDETIFINAARGGSGDNFALGRVFGIPTYIMPYIGALKSWIYSPIFWVCGVDVWTIRVPGILISVGTIILFSAFMLQQVGRGWALVTLLLLCTDPGFLLTSRTDYGPTVLMGFLKALALFGFFRWMRKPGVSRMLLWLLALLLGVWNKLDFLWILIAFFGAAAAVYGKQILRICHAEGRRAWIPVFLFGLVMLVFVLGPIRITLQADAHTTGISTRAFWQILVEAFDGRGMMDFQFPSRAGLPRAGSWVLLLPLAGLLLFPFLFTNRPRNEGLHHLPLFLLLCFGMILMQAYLTPQTGGAHHMLLAWPFPQLFAISVFASLHQALGRASAKWVTAVSGLLLLLVVGSQLRVEFLYQNLLSQLELVSPKWSPKIYDLSQVVEASDANLIVSTDWGFHPQLSSLASDENRHKYIEIWPSMKLLDTNPREESHLADLFSDQAVLFLVHAERTEEQVPSRRNTLRFLREHFPKPEIRVIRDALGRPLYELYYVEGV